MTALQFTNNYLVAILGLSRASYFVYLTSSTKVVFVGFLLLLSHLIFRKILSVCSLMVSENIGSTLTSKGIWSDGENISLVLVITGCLLITEQGFHEFQLP